MTTRTIGLQSFKTRPRTRANNAVHCTVLFLLNIIDGNTISMPETVTVSVDEVRKQFTKLRETYQKILPKVDPILLNDVLERESISKEAKPYTIEVFTKQGIDTESARAYILEKTGMAPAIFDNGTHYVTNQKLTLEMLKEISDSDDVLEVRGSFCGGYGMKGSHYERRH